MLYAHLSGFNLIGFYRRFNSVLNRLTKLVIGKKVVCFIFFFISYAHCLQNVLSHHNKKKTIRQLKQKMRTTTTAVMSLHSKKKINEKQLIHVLSLIHKQLVSTTYQLALSHSLNVIFSSWKSGILRTVPVTRFAAAIVKMLGISRH